MQNLCFSISLLVVVGEDIMDLEKAKEELSAIGGGCSLVEHEGGDLQKQGGGESG